MDQIDSLIRELEAATEGSRELDGAVGCLAYKDIGAIAVSSKDELYLEPGPDMYPSLVCPHYTTSLDAALTLVPEGFHWSMDNQYEDDEYKASCLDYKSFFKWLEKKPSKKTKSFEAATVAWWNHSRAPTPALALCIAALKARDLETLPDKARSTT